jgi:transposase-like protein
VSTRRTWSPEARAKILAGFRLGETKTELARSLGLSVTRVTHIIWQAQKEEADAEQPGELSGLSNRTRNALLSDGLDTRRRVEITAQKIGLQHIPNLGMVGREEVARWIDRHAQAMRPPQDHHRV